MGRNCTTVSKGHFISKGLLKFSFAFGDKNAQARLRVEDCFFLATERINGNNSLLVSGGLDYAIAIGWAETALQ